MSRLELGGGLAAAPGHINIDLISEADVVWDLNKGLPSIIQIDGEDHDIFEEQSIEGIRCSMLLEHLKDIIPLMNDCYEVMKPGAQFEISVPYAGTKEDYQDPTHVRHFVENSFLYFTKNSPFEKEQKEYGITARFEIVRNERGTGSDDWQLFVVLTK